MGMGTRKSFPHTSTLYDTKAHIIKLFNKSLAEINKLSIVKSTIILVLSFILGHPVCISVVY